MIYFIVGTICLAIGAVFYWLNTNSPIQTSIPAFMFPIGAVAVLIGLGRLLP
jgi:hypothetical protein